MTVQLFVLLFLLGAVTGVLAGLLGIGGGMVMVPFLVIAMQSLGFPGNELIKIAIATSLTTILFTSLSSVRAHHRRRGVRWDLVATLAPGIIIGTLVATRFVRDADSRWLTLFFSAFMAWSAWRMVWPAPRKGGETGEIAIGKTKLMSVGGVIGILSAMLGAGGGFLTIPFLTRNGVAIKEAVGTSAAIGFSIAAAGAIGYAISGPRIPLAGPVVGYIYLPALLAIALASVITAPYGASLAHRLPVAVMRRIFAGLLALLALYMGWRAWR
ncbi:MAG: sulfite exporter TauE/SafE family protein [Burkholderiaceae bacterium]